MYIYMDREKLKWQFVLSKVYVENMFRNHHRKRKGNEAVKLDTHVLTLFPSHVQASALIEKWLKIFILILSLHHYF